MTADQLDALPPGLPAPRDDGAADHLLGLAVPSVPLPSTDGGQVDLSQLPGTVVLFAYPRTGVPGEEPLVPDWDQIPGARGCTPQVCSYRDLARDFGSTRTRVVGLSTQDGAYQREAVGRLRLPYPLLSDAGLDLARAMRLPTTEVAGTVLLRRLTLVLRDGVVVHVRYPVFPPDDDAPAVLAWLREHR